MSNRAIWPAAVLTALLALSLGLAQSADESTQKAVGESAGKLAAEVAELVQSLDSKSYPVRRQSAERLAALADDEAAARIVAQRVRAALHEGQVSPEVAEQLEELRRRLPRDEADAELLRTTSAEMTALLTQLDDDAAAKRVNAQRKLRRLATEPKTSARLMAELKRRQASADLTAESRRQIRSLVKAVRRTWATSESKSWEPLPVTDEQLAEWIDTLATEDRKSAAGDSSWQAADQEIRDLLVRDDQIERVQKALTAKLAADVAFTTDGELRLRTLFNLTRPAMVAEIWDDQSSRDESRHKVVQHLIIGVPSLGPGAVRPSHFDKIDDSTAHCVSGNTLVEGDYPVGQAFRAPLREDIFFHLVNLPTPRRKLAYEFYLETDEQARLAAITKRTLDAVLASGRRLADREVSLLAQLDSIEVSRFAPKYFQAVDDADRDEAREFGNPLGRLSHHAGICLVLATFGNDEALPGLIDAIEAGRFRAPGENSPFNLPAIAAIAIANRTATAESDAQLARLLPRTEPLYTDTENPPDIGASAAAALLRRHKIATDEFSLQRYEQRFLTQLGGSGYRYEKPAARAEVIEWWQGRTTK